MTVPTATDVDLSRRVVLVKQFLLKPKKQPLKIFSYVYRLAVLRAEYACEYQAPNVQLPLAERNRCWAIEPGFDVGRAQHAADMFLGASEILFLLKFYSNKKNTNSEKILLLVLIISKPCLNQGWPKRF